MVKMWLLGPAHVCRVRGRNQNHLVVKMKHLVCDNCSTTCLIEAVAMMLDGEEEGGA
jgi:NRPS condensation-like uncharacterized protein